MVKSSLIVIRLEREMKQRIEETAAKRGLSVTTFVLGAVDRAVTKASHEEPVVRFRGVPSWFRASCMEAKRGGIFSYRSIGVNFAGNLCGMVPYEFENDEWAEKLEELESLASRDQEEDAAVWSWLDKHFPKCMALIPKRRRRQFLEGLCEHIREEGINL